MSFLDYDLPEGYEISFDSGGVQILLSPKGETVGRYTLYTNPDTIKKDAKIHYKRGLIHLVINNSLPK